MSRSDRTASRLGTRAVRVAALAAPLLLAAGCSEDKGGADSGFTVVELSRESAAPFQLAVQACAGLHNRARGGSVYVQQEDNDAQWLEELGLEPESTTDASAFLDACLAEFPACVRYSYERQQELLPSILTAAAALGAVPLDEGQATCDEVALDATVELAERDTPSLATEYVFERFAAQTTGLAMLNPGYEVDADDLSHPDLTRDMSPALVDFVFSQRLFVLFLVNGCWDWDPQYELLREIVTAGHWPTPIGVWGYNNSWLMGGYLFEAQTRCLDSRNMGAIPTKTGNLSFFSTRRAPILEASELPRNPPEEIEYDPARTYVAFVIGDGDNVRYIMSSRKDWLRQRLADCAQADNSCAPISWSLSPHLPWLAPDVLEWYYASSARTEKDYFVLPPSGHLYSYPTSLNEADQDNFVAATEQDARVLGTSGVVHWDWDGTWEDAEASFLPKYARTDGAVRGIFPINVPYMNVAFSWWPAEQTVRVLTGADGGKVAVFRPEEWRGVNDDSSEFYLSPQKMAEKLGGYPPGTVTWMYMTSDGGLSLENSFMELVKILPDHVQLVSADAAAQLAIAAGSP